MALQLYNQYGFKKLIMKIDIAIPAEIPQQILAKFNYDAKNIADKKYTNNNGDFDNHEDYEEYYAMQKKYVDSCITLYNQTGVDYIPFPVSFSTVDMVAIYKNEKEIDNFHFRILLGRKRNQTQWQFPGGFRDAGEISKVSAQRELLEECNTEVNLSNFLSIGEKFVDDIRYRYSLHKVTTNLFLIKVNEEQYNSAQAGDDLLEIQWFSLKELLADRSLIRDIHQQLFDMVVEHVTYNKI